MVFPYGRRPSSRADFPRGKTRGIQSPPGENEGESAPANFPPVIPLVEVREFPSSDFPLVKVRIPTFPLEVFSA